MGIKWTRDFPDAQFSSITGKDQNGNTYYMNVRLDYCHCTLLDGRRGCGFTPIDAFNHAIQREVKK
jgi:hypothetical protein